MSNNEQIIFEKQGEQKTDMITGDLIFVLKQTTHNTFKRVQNNLYMNMDISLKDALLGYEKTFTHLDGHEFTLVNKPNEVAQPFSWNILEGEGMPIKDSGGDYGELHAKILVNFPTKLSTR